MDKLIAQHQQGEIDDRKEMADGWKRSAARTGRACDTLSDQLVGALKQTRIPEHAFAEEAKGEAAEESKQVAKAGPEYEEPVDRLSRLVARMADLAEHDELG